MCLQIDEFLCQFHSLTVGHLIFFFVESTLKFKCVHETSDFNNKHFLYLVHTIILPWLCHMGQSDCSKLGK